MAHTAETRCALAVMDSCSASVSKIQKLASSLAFRIHLLSYISRAYGASRLAGVATYSYVLATGYFLCHFY